MIKQSQSALHSVGFINHDKIDDSSIISLADILAKSDIVFVKAAYQATLGRDPDPLGESTYLASIRSGVGKVQILEQLWYSPEGRTRGRDVPGLKTAVWRARLARLPVIGAVFAVIFRGEGNGSIERALRRIENKIFIIEQDKYSIFDRESHLKSDYASLNTSALAKPKKVDSNESSSLSNTPPLTATFTPRACKIFIALRHAEAKRSEDRDRLDS